MYLFMFCLYFPERSTELRNDHFPKQPPKKFKNKLIVTSLISKKTQLSAKGITPVKSHSTWTLQTRRGKICNSKNMSMHCVFQIDSRIVREEEKNYFKNQSRIG